MREVVRQVSEVAAARPLIKLRIEITVHQLQVPTSAPLAKSCRFVFRYSASAPLVGLPTPLPARHTLVRTRIRAIGPLIAHCIKKT